MSLHPNLIGPVPEETGKSVKKPEHWIEERKSL